MDARSAAQEGMKKRMQQKKGGNIQQGKSKEQGGFYSASNSGSKLSANSVLVLSFVFMALVMLLHVWAKLRGDRQQQPKAN